MDNNQKFLKYFLQHQNALKAYIGSMVRDPHAREDIFQEVALAMCDAFERYDESRPFKAWARGIATNKILKLWEQSKREIVAFSPEAVEAVASAYEETDDQVSDAQEALRHCMENLPERSRQLLGLRYGGALKLKDIAVRMGRTLSAAHKALARIRAGLQQCIQRRLAMRERW